MSLFILQPHDLVLATTLEWLEIADDLIGRIEGRSSLGRLGVIVHGTASVFDPGWRGKPVMELGNLGVVPVVLSRHARLRIHLRGSFKRGRGSLSFKTGK